MSENLQLNHEQTHNSEKKFPLCLVADNIDIASNIGSLFRIADALGVEKLYLTGTTETPPNHKIRKAARSTDKMVDYEYQPSARDVISQLKNKGYKIVSLEITNQSQNINEFSVSADEKLCLIIGAEKSGISTELLNASDATVHIRMFGKNSSMNVATATAIAVHELIKHFSH